MVIWLTGLSGAGKTTIARGVCDLLKGREIKCELLDGDELRMTLSRDLGFSKQDRQENVARVGCVAALLAKNGIIAIAALISPYRDQRDEIRAKLDDFIEVFVDASLETCELRDPKRLYARVRSGDVSDFTGVDSGYEPPLKPECHCRTGNESKEESIELVLRAICARRPELFS